MSNKLSWKSIRDKFPGQWVELVDFDWDWDKRYPTQASVRHHAIDREALKSLIRKNGPVEGSAVVYLGAVKSLVAKPEGAVL